MSDPARLEALNRHGVLADIDRYFALLMTKLGADDDVALAAATASAMHRAGHTCLELRNGGRRIADLVERPDSGPSAQLPDELAEARLPGRATLEDSLTASPVVGTGEATEVRPLVLDRDRLYLHRLFAAEGRLAERMLALARQNSQKPALRAGCGPEGPRTQFPPRKLLAGSHDSDVTTEHVTGRVFAEDEDRTEEATAAIRAALRRRLCIVTGGPGTGKTTLAAKLIAVLVAGGAAEPRRIGLAAPTGKAASRLQESVRGKMDEKPLNQVRHLRDFPVEARTIHRLLADRSRPLARLQALVVDECSMADLSLMVRLVTALPEECRLVLLGDANQLSSVEPGSVFSDLCKAGSNGPLAPCVTTLTKNYRFRADSGIGRLATAVVAGDAGGALGVLRDALDDKTELRPLETEAAFDDFARQSAAEWAKHMAALEAHPEGTPPFPAHRILCSHRRGPFGIARFNRLVERRLAELGRRSADDEFYVGRPIIVSRNDRQTGLSNGDTGVVLPDKEGGRTVWFPDLDRDQERYLVTPSRLPQHESFFTLTVHRAQGSEYDEVIFIPGDAASRVNTKELFYTAVTRARKKVTVLATEPAVRAAVMRTTSRATGLLDRLR